MYYTIMQQACRCLKHCSLRVAQVNWGLRMLRDHTCMTVRVRVRLQKTTESWSLTEARFCLICFKCESWSYFRMCIADYNFKFNWILHYYALVKSNLGKSIPNFEGFHRLALTFLFVCPTWIFKLTSIFRQQNGIHARSIFKLIAVIVTPVVSCFVMANFRRNNYVASACQFPQPNLSLPWFRLMLPQFLWSSVAS